MALDPITAGIDLINTIVGKVVKDPNQAQAARAALDQMQESGELQLALAQIGVNQTESQNPHFFVAGARPALLWVCVLSFTYHFVVYPFSASFFPALHDLDGTSVSILMAIMMTLIGARSYEKMNDVATVQFGSAAK